MTTGWLLLLLLIVSSDSADSQSTTDDETCSGHGDGDLLSKLQSDIERILDNQQQIFQLLQQNQDSLKRLDDLLEKSTTASVAGLHDCSEIYNYGQRSDGVYTVYIGTAQRPVQVFCDMTTDGGGWTVFQRRRDGSENFYREWTDYQAGFGDLAGEFWLGNDNLHLMTSDERQRLRIDLADFEGNTRYAEYDNFAIDSAAGKYRLVSVGTYSTASTAGNSMAVHVGQKFSTRDQDNDVDDGACAVIFKGAWWYRACHASNLNGLYLRGNHTSYADGVEWYGWTGHHYSLRFTEMKIKPFEL